MRDGPLDMRMSPGLDESAYELIERVSEKELADIIYQFGEERFSRRIARVIKEKWPIADSTLALADLIAKAVGRKERIHPATRTFQALRIAVNGELSELASLLNYLPEILAPHGRAAIISFHSLEDRLVKHASSPVPSRTTNVLFLRRPRRFYTANLASCWVLVCWAICRAVIV